MYNIYIYIYILIVENVLADLRESYEPVSPKFKWPSAKQL